MQRPRAARSVVDVDSDGMGSSTFATSPVRSPLHGYGWGIGARRHRRLKARCTSAFQGGPGNYTLSIQDDTRRDLYFSRETARARAPARVASRGPRPDDAAPRQPHDDHPRTAHTRHEAADIHDIDAVRKPRPPHSSTDHDRAPASKHDVDESPPTTPPRHSRAARAIRRCATMPVYRGHLGPDHRCTVPSPLDAVNCHVDTLRATSRGCPRPQPWAGSSRNASGAGHACARRSCRQPLHAGTPPSTDARPATAVGLGRQVPTARRRGNPRAPARELIIALVATRSRSFASCRWPRLTKMTSAKRSRGFRPSPRLLRVLSPVVSRRVGPEPAAGSRRPAGGRPPRPDAGPPPQTHRRHSDPALGFAREGRSEPTAPVPSQHRLGDGDLSVGLRFTPSSMSTSLGARSIRIAHSATGGR